jgi:tetratricopeptide (TPR) repeat protein
MSDATVASWIDAEAQGDAQILAALDRAKHVLRHLREWPDVALLISLPQFGFDFGRENRFFASFFAAARGPGSLIFVGTPATLDVEGFLIDWSTLSDPSPESRVETADFHAEVVAPGGHTSAKPAAIALDGGWSMASPAARSDPTQASTETLCHIALTGAPNARAFAETRLVQRGLGDARLLAQMAWESFSVGGNDTGLLLLTHAQVAARDAFEAGMILLMQQSMRIALQRYREAAVVEALPAPLPEPVRRALIASRAWGMVMSGQPGEALTAFGLARGDGKFADSPWLDLYLRNINALAHLRAGDAERALQLEAGIEESLDVLDDEAWHIRYLNCINIARLHRRDANIDEAESYYNRAFETTKGVFMPSDLVYRDVCRAQLCEARGDLYPAFTAWLRACLNLAAFEVPEALGWRVASAIINRAVAWDGVDAEEVLSAARARLEHAAAALGIDKPCGVAAATLPIVSRDLYGRASEPGAMTMVGAQGWAVGVIDCALEPPYDSPAAQALRAALAGLLRTTSGNPPELARGAIILDTRDGQGLPENRPEAIETALRYSTGKLVWNGVHIDPGPVDWSRARVKIGPAVSCIRPSADDGATVHFKRYRSPYQITAAELRMLRSERAGDLDALHRLEEERVLTVERATAGN